MANFSEQIFEYITISNTVTANVNTIANVVDEVNFSDSSQIFNIYNSIVNNECNFTIQTDCTISDYIKKTETSEFNISDSVFQTVIFRDGIKENVEISDIADVNIFTSQSIQDQILVRSDAYANVIYGTDTIADEFDISDSVMAIISRHSTRNFKNAMLNMVGTTEETIYTCNVKSTTVINISLCNIISSDVNVDVIIYKGGVTPIYIMKGILVKPHQAYVINNNDETNIQLEETDELRVISNVSNSSDIYMALMEQT